MSPSLVPLNKPHITLVTLLISAKSTDLQSKDSLLEYVDSCNIEAESNHSFVVHDYMAQSQETNLLIVCDRGGKVVTVQPSFGCYMLQPDSRALFDWTALLT